MRPKRSLALSALLLSAAIAPLEAQQAGRLTGRVVHAETGEPLPGAQVFIEGGTQGSLSTADGRYLLVGVPAGSRDLTVQLIGFARKTITGIIVRPDRVTLVDVSMVPEAVALQAITVTAAAERGTVSRALDEQRTAAGIVNAITSEQISRSPDGDAAAAVRRVSGVSVEDGRYVAVRGLGNRYTTTSLNGARLPSPEPERKLVPLDLFPAGVLQTVTTSKTFTPNQPGDFSGGAVDIQTRDFAARRQLAFSASTGWATAATGERLLLAPRENLDWLALGADSRSLPAPLTTGALSGNPSQDEINHMVAAFRNAWSVQERKVAPNGSLGVSAAGSGDLAGARLGYVASGTYSRSFAARVDERRALALPTSAGGEREIDRFEGSTGVESVLWGGLLNLSAVVGGSTRLVLNNVYNRTSDNEARRELGSSENLGGTFQIDRLRYVERAVRSSQLKAEHRFGDRLLVDLSLSSSGVARLEPDRSEFVWLLEEDASGRATPVWFSTSNQAAVRTFGDLEEEAWEGALNLRHAFGTGRYAVRVGALYRVTDRSAENTSYSISARLDEEARRLDPERIFDGRFSGPDSDAFRLTPLGAGGSYRAEDRLVAGYGMAEMDVSSRTRAVLGGRVERSRVAVGSEPTVGAEFVSDTTYIDLLPSATLNIALKEDQNLRLSASRTLARPEYRELSAIQFRDVIGGDVVQGNPGLRRTLIQNYDLRWEWYPDRGEVLSVALFAKRFQDPIEQIYLATSGSRVVTFLNAESASNYGVELEARKSLGFAAEALSNLVVFSNLTLMRSRISIGSQELASSKLSDERPMTGQAPYVLNAGVAYEAPESGLGATLLFNVVGERIVSAAEAPLPDVYEQPRSVLDFSLRVPVSQDVSAKLDASNLLDSAHHVVQGGVSREYHRSGRLFSFGLSWRP